MVRRATPRSEAKDKGTPSSAPAAGPERRDITSLDINPEGGEAITSESGTSPNEEDIRLRAYHRYLERGSVDGSAFDDWLEAERELKRSKVGS